MCGWVEFGFTGGVIVWGIWYSFKVLKQAILDILSACRNTDLLAGGWALLKILAVPLIFLGIQLAGILALEIIYSCQ